jgi:multimeric flavodoxin WrbA
MDRRFLFVLGSSRSESNTEMLARRAAEQLPPDVEQQWISLAEHPVPDFVDVRHDSDHIRPTEGNLALLLDATLAATDIVIASPLYWYSVSAPTKRYLDHWSGWLRTPGLGFKATLAGRTLWGVTALAHRGARSPTRSSARSTTRPPTWGCGSAVCCSATAASRGTYGTTPRHSPVRKPSSRGRHPWRASRTRTSEPGR